MLILVNEGQLDGWVRYNPEEAQGVIVELVLRLVTATCPKPRERRFPLGDSIGQHGPDGILEVDLAFEPFVPEGRSIWEIGASKRAGDKATDDYNDRTRNTPEAVRHESTFVFVTPLSGRLDWEYTWKEDAQAAWLEDRRARGDWKDVKVIDGTKLIDWLHQFPAVELWLAQLILHLPSQEIETLEQQWDILRSVGGPPLLTPDVFLANRDEACEKLKEVFDDAAGELKLTTRFPDQVTDFVSAYVASLDPESHVEAVSRCLIVSGIEAWNAICTQTNSFILIADPALDLNGDLGARLIQKARRAGHAVVFAGPHGGIPDSTSVTLHTPRVHQLQEALVTTGHGEERARTLAQKSDGNLSSLLRYLRKTSAPEWAESSEASDLAIAVLLGSWADSSQADRDAVEGIVGEAYGEWIGKMRAVSLHTSSPLIQREGNWKFMARYEGWYALGPRLFDEHLNRLQDAAVSVLRERDPQFELAPEERHMAGIYGQVLAHSQLMRNGLAESLALLGSHPKAATSASRGKAKSTARLAVREILHDADWMQWASLDGVLPLLAEAAPREFLDAVEAALSTDPCPFDELFAQEGKGQFGRTYLSGLLWALETLAWDADYLTNVVLLLGELDSHDPGGRWMNRPGNSLTTILLPWLPQTCAPLARRAAAVRVLLDEFPGAGWKLLLTLLPRAHAVSHRTRRPAWRATIPDDWQEGVTHQEHWEQVSAYSELAFVVAQKDISRLAELIDRLEDLPQATCERVLDYLGSDAVLAMAGSNRQILWNKLHSLARKHKRFADADWEMEPDQVEQIASLADRLSPEDPLLRHQWLFREGDFDLYEQKGDFEEQARNLENRRRQAVEELATEGHTRAVVEFAQSVEVPGHVGTAYGFIASKDADLAVLPAMLESDQRLAQFARGYVLSRFENGGWQWVDGIDTSKWSASAIGQFLSFLPFTQDTWERSRRLLGEDESAYWTKVTGFTFRAESGLEYAIEQLLRYGRPYAAIRSLYGILHDQQSLDTNLAARVLLQAFQTTESRHQSDDYQVIQIIQALQDHPDTNADDLIRIEWAYLPLLDDRHGASPRFLEQRLAIDPALFYDLIRIGFLSDEEAQSGEEPSQTRQNLASNAYRLLDRWRMPPGYREDGTYDGDALVRWLEDVKEKCAASRHLDIAMSMLGQVLIYAPPDPDGLWIHRSAAAVLNARDADDIRTGFHTALYNSRGAHWIDPTGRPERELAAKYRAQAEAVEEGGFHRLATTLRDLAAAYEREAERVSSREPLDG